MWLKYIVFGMIVIALIVSYAHEKRTAKRDLKEKLSFLRYGDKVYWYGNEYTFCCASGDLAILKTCDNKNISVLFNSLKFEK